MALPKLNDSPKYSVTVPSTKKKVTFRPYLVKEEKILLMALESQDGQAALNAVIDTISACIQTKIDVSTLTPFDVEYLFTQIRAKSSGETTNVGIKCSNCSVVNEIDVKLDDIGVTMPKVKDKVELTDDVTMEFKWPTYLDIAKFESVDTENVTTEQAFEMALTCIKAVVFKDERTMAEDCTKEDLLEFIESMTTQQFKNVMDWLGNMPKMEHTIKFSCVDCKEENEQLLSGLQSFFS